MAKILGFVAEWFDDGPQLTKRFLLKIFVGSNEIEVAFLSGILSFISQEHTTHPPNRCTRFVLRFTT